MLKKTNAIARKSVWIGWIERRGKFPIFLVSKGTSVEELFYMSLACSVGRKEERGRRGSPPSDSFLFSYLSYSRLLGIPRFGKSKIGLPIF